MENISFKMFQIRMKSTLPGFRPDLKLCINATDADDACFIASQYIPKQMKGYNYTAEQIRDNILVVQVHELNEQEQQYMAEGFDDPGFSSDDIEDLF